MSDQYIIKHVLTSGEYYLLGDGRVSKDLNDSVLFDEDAVEDVIASYGLSKSHDVMMFRAQRVTVATTGSHQKVLQLLPTVTNMRSFILHVEDLELI